MEENLQKQGWYLKPSGLKECQYKLKKDKPTANDVMKYALNIDLKRHGCRALPTDYKEKSEVTGPAVVQLQKVRNLSAPLANPDSTHAPPLYKVFLVDGDVNIHGIIIDAISCISLQTPPGSKLRLCNEIRIRNGFLLLHSKNVEFLGGEVEEMKAKWKLSKDLKTVERSSTKGNGPPPFEPFKEENFKPNEITLKKQNNMQATAKPNSTKPVTTVKNNKKATDQQQQHPKREINNKDQMSNRSNQQKPNHAEKEDKRPKPQSEGHKKRVKDYESDRPQEKSNYQKKPGQQPQRAESANNSTSSKRGIDSVGKERTSAIRTPTQNTSSKQSIKTKSLYEAPKASKTATDTKPTFQKTEQNQPQSQNLPPNKVIPQTDSIVKTSNMTSNTHHIQSYHPRMNSNGQSNQGTIANVITNVNDQRIQQLNSSNQPFNTFPNQHILQHQHSQIQQQQAILNNVLQQQQQQQQQPTTLSNRPTHQAVINHPSNNLSHHHYNNKPMRNNTSSLGSHGKANNEPVQPKLVQEQHKHLINVDSDTTKKKVSQKDKDEEAYIRAMEEKLKLDNQGNDASMKGGIVDGRYVRKQPLSGEELQDNLNLVPLVDKKTRRQRLRDQQPMLEAKEKEKTRLNRNKSKRGGISQSMLPYDQPHLMSLQQNAHGMMAPPFDLRFQAQNMSHHPNMHNMHHQFQENNATQYGLQQIQMQQGVQPMPNSCFMSNPYQSQQDVFNHYNHQQDAGSSHLEYQQQPMYFNQSQMGNFTPHHHGGAYPNDFQPQKYQHDIYRPDQQT